MAGRKEAKTSVKFALTIMSVGAEGLDMMRIKDLNICSIKQSTDELSVMSAQKNSCHARKPHKAFGCVRIARMSAGCFLALKPCDFRGFAAFNLEELPLPPFSF